MKPPCCCIPYPPCIEFDICGCAVLLTVTTGICGCILLLTVTTGCCDCGCIEFDTAAVEG